MSVIKTKKTVCDICGKEIKNYLTKYTFKASIGDRKPWKQHMCNDCYYEFKKWVRNKEKSE